MDEEKEKNNNSIKVQVSADIEKLKEFLKEQKDLLAKYNLTNVTLVDKSILQIDLKEVIDIKISELK